MFSTLRTWVLGAPDTRVAHVQALDGLRGLAVLIVIASHLSNTGWLPQPGLGGTGKSGVYLFFVLSAFLLSRAMFLQAPGRLREVNYWAAYALRRVLRIWPLFLVVLFASWALTVRGIGGLYPMDTRTLWAHLGLREGEDVLWSIPVEFTFYFWLPLIVGALILLRRIRGGRWWGLAVLTGLMAFAQWRWPAAQAVANSVHLGFYLVVFVAGVGAAWIDAQWPARALQARWRMLGWVLLVLLCATVPSLWSWVLDRPFEPELTQRLFIPFGVGWGLMVLAVLRGGGVFARFFSSAPMRWTGVVSFSAYLWHMPVVGAMDRLGLKAWGLPGVVVLLFAVFVAATASFLVFERPWRDLRLRSAATQRVVA